MAELAEPRAFWVAYPKGNRSDVNRDSLWPILAEHGMRPISQVAVDDVVVGAALPRASRRASRPSRVGADDRGPPGTPPAAGRDLADRLYAEPPRRPRAGAGGAPLPAHFSREFTRAFGETPHRYLLTRRLERAAALLRTTDRRSPTSA